MTLNPILAFSARRRMRSPRTAILLTLYCLAVLVFGLGAAFSTYLRPTLSLYSLGAGLEGYVLMVLFQFFLLLLVSPALTAGSISGERERQTLELLLVTNTGSLRIVLGKLLETLGLVLLLIIATLPSLCLCLLTGAMSLPHVLLGLAYLGVTAFACLSVGMFCSTLFRRTVAATVVSYLVVFAIGLGTLLPLLRDMASMRKAYDMLYISSMPAPSAAPSVDGMTLVSFELNPALGLLSLLAWQTGLLRSTIGNYSYQLYELYDYLDFRAMALRCMAFMGACGLALNLASACLVRPRKMRVKARKTEKKA